MKILIAACIKQDHEILREFLESLDQLKKPFKHHYFFITTLEEESKNLLEEWATDKQVIIKEEKVNEPYIVDEDTHHWTPEHVKTLMRLRDIYINEARNGDYDYLFSMDSDIYFHPETLVRLLNRKKDIITEIHWTKWSADAVEPLPNVWFHDNYGFPPGGVERLKREKLVKVGGVAGTYLISKKALKAGVSFTTFKGVPTNWWEDRHFAGRARALGFDLWCDTTLPSFHIYRVSDLPRLQEWKKRLVDRGFEVLDCRWGTKSELEKPEFKEVVNELDAFKPVFPRWSRCWEYPYAYLNSDLQDNHRVLDAGCGDSPLKFLLEKHCWEVHCIDREQVDIPENSNIIFKRCDILKIDYPDNHFDREYCISVLEHAQQPPIKYVMEMLRVLKIGGTLHLTLDFNRWSTQWRFKEHEILSLCQQLGVIYPPKPDDLLKSEEHSEGATVGEGLSVLGFTIRKTAKIEQTWDDENQNEEYMVPPVKVTPGTVLIGVCVGEREIHSDTSAWITRTLLNHRGWGLDISRGHPIDSNRNNIVKKFMSLPEAQKYEWLLFLDTDVVPPDGAVDRLLSHGKRVVGGVCPIMGTGGVPIPNISKEMPPGYAEAKLIEVNGMGTGFLLIHREVLEKVGKSPFRFRYDEWGTASVCGEDYDFCEKATNAGYKIYADLGVQCEHYKLVGLLNLNRKLAEIINKETTQ